VPGRLGGKVCVITGTGGSMGRATALAFARGGAADVGCDAAVEPAERAVELVRAAGGEMASLQPCWLAERAEADRLVEFAVKEHDRIDVLNNLAARIHFNWLEDTPDED
jgi:NAD(P)-dependent dehydrogenase (short-subunit alcohol dehydrogenase family)